MEFGIFHEFWSAKAPSQAHSFADSFAEIAAAENWGLDVVWPRTGMASLRLWCQEVMPRFK